MRAAVCLGAMAAMVLLAGDANAGSFDGFTSDGRYVVSGTKLCTPIDSAKAPSAAPVCANKSSAEIAKLTLERPKKEQGARARFSAKGSGSKLSITAAGENKAATTWDSGSPVGSVLGVYVNKAGTAVALEYESRFGGRMVTDVVGFRVAAAGTGTDTNTNTNTNKPTPEPAKPEGPTLSEKDAEKLDKFLRVGWKQLGRKRWAKAAGAASSALLVWDQSAEALAILAAAKARSKDNEAALVALERLANSKDPAAPEYRVDARTASAFAKLRADKRYRLAVGITPDPNKPPTAYERVMGFGGKWEQRLISCEQPEVKLKLKRTRKRFTLRIKSRCGGTDTTYLDGSWKASGADDLKLTFHNRGSDDEGMTCQIERCRDSSGEDCVRCKVDADLEFLLRVIRR